MYAECSRAMGITDRGRRALASTALFGDLRAAPPLNLPCHRCGRCHDLVHCPPRDEMEWREIMERANWSGFVA